MLSSDVERQERILLVTQLRTFWLQELKLLKLILMVRILNYLNFILLFAEKKCQRVEGNFGKQFMLKNLTVCY